MSEAKPLVGLAATTLARKIAVLYTRGCANVVLGAKGPRTDGKTIWLPDLADPGSAQEALALLVSGTHEIGHCKYSTQLLETDAIRIKENPVAPWLWSYGVPAEHSKLFHTCVNVAEDVRVEKLLHVEYPGLLPDYYDDHVAFVETTEVRRLADHAVPATKKLMDLLLLRASEVKYMSHGLRCLPDMTMDPDLQDLWEGVAHLVPLLVGTETAAEAESAGWAVYKALLYLSKPEEPDDKNKGSGDSEDDKGVKDGEDEQGDGGTSGTGADASGTDGEGIPETADGRTPCPSSTGGEEGGGDGAEATPDVRVGYEPVEPEGGSRRLSVRLDPSELEMDILAPSEERRRLLDRKAGIEVGYSVGEDVVDIWLQQEPSDANACVGRAAIASGLALLGSSAPRMRSLFLSEHSMVIRGGQVKGRHLDPGRLSRIATTPPWQKPRIWERRTPGSAVDAAVEIAVDESGSMGGAMAVLSYEISAGLAVTLERARIPVEVIGYSASGGSSSYTVRTNPAVFNVIKSFEEPRVMPHRFSPHGGGNNSDPDILKLMGARLLGRREPKKVLMFLSDGAPHNGMVTAAATLAFRRELALLASRGVIVFGFGMDADLGMYFTDHNQFVNVKSGKLRELPRIMLAKLEKILL